MKVKDLIEQLKKYDPNLHVKTEIYFDLKPYNMEDTDLSFWGHTDIEGVELCKKHSVILTMDKTMDRHNLEDFIL
jgi:hypothetical protein